MVLVLLLLVGSLQGFSQESAYVDSLKKRLSGFLDDRDRMNTCMLLTGAMESQDPYQYQEFAQKTLEIAERLGNDSMAAHARYAIAKGMGERGSFDSAMAYFRVAHEQAKLMGDTGFIIGTSTALGNTLYYQGNHKGAIRWHTESLKLGRATGDFQAMANAHNNLGIIYSEQKLLDEAMIHYREAQTIFRQLNDIYGLASAELNMGNIFSNKALSDSSLRHFLIADSLFAIKGSPYAISLNWGNLAEAYFQKGNLKMGRYYFEKAIKLQEEIGDEYGMAFSSANLALIDVAEKRYDEAMAKLELADEVGLRVGAIGLREMAYKGRYTLFAAKGDWKLALENYQMQVALRDSVLDLDTRKMISGLEAEYESQQKEAELAQNALVLRKRNLQLTSSLLIVCLLALSIVVIVFFVQRLRLANGALALEQSKLREVNREVTDSIHSAERLQRASLPDLVPDVLAAGSNFILFKPRDIVSGDFYWAHRISRDRYLIAVADCTGHGVPGALLSIAGFITLDRCVKEFGLLMPEMVLRRAHQLLQGTFNRPINAVKEYDPSVRDGMDISLCMVELNTRIIHYSGARSMGLIVPVNGSELIELRGDRFSIGDGPEPKQIRTISQKLEENDLVVLFSDGITDQFGGEKDRKFGLARWKHWLENHRKSDPDTMGQALQEDLTQWMGNSPQTDDITVLAFQVKGNEKTVSKG